MSETERLVDGIQAVSLQDVVDAIDWLGGWAETGELEFFEANYATASETGKVYLEGRKDTRPVMVTVQIVEISVGEKEIRYDEWGDPIDE